MFGRKSRKERQNSREDIESVSLPKKSKTNDSFELYINIPSERIHKLSNEYISNAIMEGRTINESELNNLSCAELALLYTNTDWFIASVIQSDQPTTSIGRQNQNAFKNAIIQRIKSSEFYVIYTYLTHLPYLFSDMFFLIYTDKEKAEQVARHFGNEYKIVPFLAKELNSKDEDSLALFYICGLHKFIVDGAKLEFSLDDIYSHDNSKYGCTNPFLNLSMIKLTQYLYLKGDGYQFDPREADTLFAPIIDGLENAKLLLPINTVQEGTLNAGFSSPLITKRDGSKWVPLFTDQFAANQYYKKIANDFNRNFRITISRCCKK